MLDPSNDTELTDCPLLGDEKNRPAGNAKATEEVNKARRGRRLGCR